MSTHCALSLTLPTARAHMGDAKAREALVAQNIALVKHIVRRFLGRGVEYDDLFQFGCMGLLKAIDRFVDDSLMRHGSLGVIVVDVKSGKTLGSRNANMACITASTMKTVTSSAALELLGADYTFQTPVYLEGEIQGDCLNGDIVIEGVGDPTLGSVYFKENLDIVNEIVEFLKKQGIKEIFGKLRVDKSRYYYPAFNGER